MEFLEGVGGGVQAKKTFRGRGMDIFLEQHNVSMEGNSLRTGSRLGLGRDSRV